MSVREREREIDSIASELYIVLATGKRLECVSENVGGFWTSKVCPYLFKENSGFVNFLRET